jgi:hypothetical protein
MRRAATGKDARDRAARDIPDNRAFEKKNDHYRVCE